MTRKRILISNDDGIHAKGIYHLFKALEKEVEIFIVAPAFEQSAKSVSVTLRKPIAIEKKEWPSAEAWAVYGTPADCVRIALHSILDFKPDLIVSGINRGSNAGGNYLYSGTVAAAIEGVMNGIPSIAFSCQDYPDPDYSLAETDALKIVRYFLDHPMREGTLMNVTFPAKTYHPMRGIKLTRNGRGFYGGKPDKRVHPTDHYSYYWLGGTYMAFEEHEESDVSWLQKGFTTVAPLHIFDVTDKEFINDRKNHFEAIVS